MAGHTELLEEVQRRAAKVVLEIRQLTYRDWLAVREVGEGRRRET